MDRREPVSHHPLPELTRNALRTVAFGWLHEDWFAALKTGLAPAVEGEIDKLENEALARGWRGTVWKKPITIRDDPELTAWLAGLQARVLPSFQQLASGIAAAQNRPTGPQLAGVLRDFWARLEVEQRLQIWAEAETRARRGPAVLLRSSLRSWILPSMAWSPRWVGVVTPTLTQAIFF